jgi:hypothetical protein
LGAVTKTWISKTKYRKRGLEESELAALAACHLLGSGGGCLPAVDREET